MNAYYVASEYYLGECYLNTGHITNFFLNIIQLLQCIEHEKIGHWLDELSNSSKYINQCKEYNVLSHILQEQGKYNMFWL